MTELPKTFDPAEIESRWYAHWETRGLFRPDRPNAEPWTIVNPPPNVTGSLHIGHALDNTLQDILARHARLKGKDALWVVGTDHAGIATQMVVERQMAAKGEKRTDLTRAAFIDKVWAWKEESGGEITQQLRRLGCSMDWANERFTMDEGFSKAVLKVFVDLHKEGLLYRDKRLVNWDPGLGTAISDLEVETREIKGSFWHLRYPLDDGSGFIEVATTRPETMLADMAVAVHPTDERYTALVGKHVRLPITGRLIPIVADEHADPELGSGAVKITPGHDFNDFEVGKRAGFIAPADDAEHVRCRGEGGAARRTGWCRSEFDRAGHGSEARAASGRADEARGGFLMPLRRQGRRRARRRTAHHPDPLWRPVGRGDRTVADRPMVCRRQQRWRGPAIRSGEDRARMDHRAEGLGEDLLQLDGKYPAMVRVAAIMVGAPDPGMVRA